MAAPCRRPQATEGSTALRCRVNHSTAGYQHRMNDEPETRDNPIAVVTGASSGIGREVARELADRGFHVVLMARRAEELERTLNLIDGRGSVIVCDMSDMDQVEAAAAQIHAQFGRCDTLINNAGVGTDVLMTDRAAPEALDLLMRVNFLSAARLTNRLLPDLRAAAASPRAGMRGASVVNISSVAGLMGLPSASIYCSTKFAFTGWSQGLHAELHSEGIWVACVHPGPVPTEGWPHEDVRSRWYRPLAASTSQRVARLIVRQAMRGRGNPAPVIPVSYRGVVLLAALMPWALRRVLRRASRSNRMSYVGESHSHLGT